MRYVPAKRRADSSNGDVRIHACVGDIDLEDRVVDRLEDLGLVLLLVVLHHVLDVDAEAS